MKQITSGNEAFIKDLEDIKEEVNKQFSVQNLGGILFCEIHKEILKINNKIDDCINKYKTKEGDEERTEKNGIIGERITNTPDFFTVHLRGE